MLGGAGNTKLGREGAKGIQKATGKVPNDRASSPEQDKDMQQERSSETAVWLHGTMSIEVLGAVGLPRHRVLLSCRQQVVAPASACLGVTEKMICGVRPPKAYVTVNLGAATRARTSIIKTSTSPVWNERFLVPVADKVSHIRLVIKDNNSFTAPPIGHAKVPVSEIAPGQKFDAWVDLLDDREQVVQKKDPLRKHNKAQLHVTMTFSPVSQDPGWGNGLGAGPDMGSVPHTYFQMRHGCRMHLYNDAYQDPAWQPSFKLDNGEFYKARGAWTDLYDAILAAKHLIYITGWSVYRMIHLRREDGVKPQDGKYPSLGEMLIQRANAGVRVCVLVWDDKTSLNAPLMRTEGLMVVHDEDMFKFFDDTKVVVRKAARNAGGKDDSWVYWLQRGSMFTHHQKSVIMDAPQAESSPASAKAPVRMVAFMGGLDLCDGRYDDRNHWLFRTLHTQHNMDYHQACIKGATIEKGGPRQPWHDVHAMVEGPIVWDLLANFTARWRKQAGTLHARKLRKMQEIPGLQVPQRQQGVQDERRGDPCTFAVEPHDQEAFCAQLFRSIDSTSAVGLPSQQDEAFSLGLTSGKGRTIECSIQMGYVNAIRRARRFIYIENQYFLGSSHMWEDHIGAGGSVQTVPVEIALKVASQIRAGRNFAAYILLPMWPEGFPETGAVQEVLFWQTCTLRMMFKIVGDALAEVGQHDKHPGDYLIFLTVGSREPREAGEPDPEQKAPQGNYTAAQEARRFMIYVHSKYMVVDDEYAIVGSANINQRSLDGARDTELAIGHFQPFYTHRTSDGPTVKGQVYGFRATLWEEHFGTWKPCMEKPESPECVREVQNLSRVNWEHYVQPEVVKLPGHIMPYPIKVLDNGIIEPLPGYENFPDTQAKVLGSEIGSMPDMLTS